MIIVTGTFVAREDRLPQALEFGLDHVRRSRREPGCLAHQMHQNVENPSRFFFYEEWADMAALDAHFAVPATRAFAKSLRLIADDPVLLVYQADRIR